MQPRLNNKVFLQISAWRDPFMLKTIESAYKNAYSPNDIVFGCVFQGYEEDDWMLDGLHDISPNIKLIKLDANTAPLSLCKIRGEIGCSLMTDEAYYMQVDAHTKFNKYWDIFLKVELDFATKQWGDSIITAQSSNFHRWDDPFIENNQISLPDEETFKQIGAPVVGKLVTKSHSYQVREKFFNANCVFAYSDYVTRVPQPNNVLFQYEQPMMALRTFTGGYSMVSPTKSYTSVFDYHMPEKDMDPYVKYIRFEDPKWKDKWGQEEQNQKLNYEKVVSENIIDPVNGLLDVRTLEEFIEFTGYNPLTLEVIREQELYEKGNFLTISSTEFTGAVERMKDMHD